MCVLAFSLPSFTTSFDLIAFIQIGFPFQLVAHIHSFIYSFDNSQLSSRETEQDRPTKKKTKTPKYCAHNCSYISGTVCSFPFAREENKPTKERRLFTFVAHKFHGNDFRIIHIFNVIITSIIWNNSGTQPTTVNNNRARDRFRRALGMQIVGKGFDIIACARKKRLPHNCFRSREARVSAKQKNSALTKDIMVRALLEMKILVEWKPKCCILMCVGCEPDVAGFIGMVWCGSRRLSVSLRKRLRRRLLRQTVYLFHC